MLAELQHELPLKIINKALKIQSIQVKTKLLAEKKQIMFADLSPGKPCLVQEEANQRPSTRFMISHIYLSLSIPYKACVLLHLDSVLLLVSYVVT
jgi:hypothetical protein